MPKSALAKIHSFSFKTSRQNSLLSQSNEWHQALAQLSVKGSPEEVHRVRVLSRRLRALAGVLKHADGKSSLKKWQRELKKTTRYFGELRSWEVSVSTLKQFKKDLVLVEKVNDQPTSPQSLKKIQQAFKKYAKSLRKKTLSSKAFQEQRSSVLKVHFGSWTIALKEENLKAALETECQKRLKQLLYHWHSFEQHRSLSTLHPFRISLKKWRYCLELYQLASQTRLEPKLKKLKTWQDALGEIHDWQVLQQHLKEDVLKKQLKDYPAQKSLRKTNKALRACIAQKIQERMQTLPHEIKEILL